MTSILCTKPPAGINQSFQKIACTIRMISVSVAFILFVAAALRALASGSMSEDNEIRKALQEYLEVEIPAAKDGVSVDVQNGVVMLTGTVENLLQKSQARQVAESVRRVRSVIDDTRSVAVKNNRVRLTGTVDSMGQKVSAENIVSQIEGVLTVDNRIKVAASPPHQASDADISAAINDELYWSPYLESERLTVTVEDGQATLKGRATDRFVVRIAVQNAFKGGARSVRTHLILNDGSIVDNLYGKKPAMRFGITW